MRRLLVIVSALLFLSGCGWAVRRAGCGLWCPANAHCAVWKSGLFTEYDCVCDIQQGGQYRPSKGHPCPVPSPSVKP